MVLVLTWPLGPRVTSVLKMGSSGGMVSTRRFRQVSGRSCGSELHSAQTSERGAAPAPGGQAHGMNCEGAEELKPQLPATGSWSPTQSLVPKTHMVGRPGSLAAST